jgi:hypothetical protein
LISYLLGPIAGAALVAWLVRRSESRRVLTHHLSGKHVEIPDEARLSRHRGPADTLPDLTMYAADYPATLGCYVISLPMSG